MFSKLLSVDRKQVSQHVRQLESRRPRFEPLEPRTLLSISTVQPMPLWHTNSDPVATDLAAILPASTSAVAMADANSNSDVVAKATSIRTVVTMEWSKTSGITIRWKAENGAAIPNAQVRFSCSNTAYGDPNMRTTPEDWRFPITYSRTGVQKVARATVLKMVGASGDPDGPYNHAWAAVIPWPMTDNPYTGGFTELEIPDERPDLVVTDFTTHGITHAPRDNTRLNASITVKNDSTVKSPKFDILFYAEDSIKPGHVKLTTGHGPEIAPGQSVTITGTIKDPIYVHNDFENGYYIVAQVDPNKKIEERNEDNNSMQLNMVDYDHISEDKFKILAVAAGFKVFLLNGVAAQGLAHWLDGTGTTLSWGPNDFAGDELRNCDEFKASAQRATAYLRAHLTQSVNATGKPLTDLAVGTKIIGRPSLDDDLDLHYGFAGTKDSMGQFSGVRITSSQKVKGKTVYTFEANLWITYFDSYDFDVQDAFKRLTDCARHLQMCGYGKGFVDSISATTTVQGQFSSNRAIPVPGSSEVASGVILDITADADFVAMVGAIGPNTAGSDSGRILSAANDAALLAVLYQQNASA